MWIVLTCQKFRIYMTSLCSHQFRLRLSGAATLCRHQFCRIELLSFDHQGPDHSAVWPSSNRWRMSLTVSHGDRNHLIGLHSSKRLSHGPRVKSLRGNHQGQRQDRLINRPDTRLHLTMLAATSKSPCIPAAIHTRHGLKGLSRPNRDIVST